MHISAFIFLVFFSGSHHAVGEYMESMDQCTARATVWAQDREGYDLELGKMPAIVFGPLGAADGNLNALCYNIMDVPKGLHVSFLHYSDWTPPWVHPPQVAWASR